MSDEEILFEISWPNCHSQHMFLGFPENLNKKYEEINDRFEFQLRIEFEKYLSSLLSFKNFSST